LIFNRYVLFKISLQLFPYILSIFVLELKFFLYPRIRVFLIRYLSIQFINILHAKKINIRYLETRVSSVFNFLTILRYSHQILHRCWTVHGHLRFWINTFFTLQSLFFWFRLTAYKLREFILCLLNYFYYLWLFIIHFHMSRKIWNFLIINI
jgi:hypothetical protein